MKEFLMQSPFKINLTLRITGKDSEGYHTLASGVFKFSGGDGLCFCEAPSEEDAFREDRVVTENYHIEGKNILLRALGIMRRKMPFFPWQHIRINKIIPPGTGVGGGSGNLAAFLSWMDLRYGIRLSVEEILSLGADVPFLYSPYTCGFLTGIGEKIEPIHGNMDCVAFLCFPSWTSNTRKAYGEIDRRKEENKMDWSSEAQARGELFSLLRKLRKGEFCGLFPNDFLEVLPHQEAYESFFSLASLRGALGWGVSGSGSSMYALYSRRENMETDNMQHFLEAVANFSWIQKNLYLELC